MSQSLNQHSAFRPDIQGLRAIAVLAVMLFHLNAAWLPGGFVGVDVFLVISGYLIARILIQKREQTDYQLGAALRYFYISRFKRIAPAYFAMLVLVSLLAGVLLLPQDLTIYKKGLNQAAWFHSNSYFASFGDYFAPASHEQPLLHTWSLAVEIQFYLLAPFFVLLLPVRALRWVMGLLLVVFTALAQYRLNVLGIEQATYYSLYARLPEFFTGALVALFPFSVRRGGWHATVGLVLVLAAAVAQPLLGRFPGVPALLPTVGAALILLHPSKGIAQRLLGCRPMVWLGELSYSLYLWHWPILALLRYYTGDQVLDMPFSVLFIALTLLMATLSFLWVETPLRARHIRLKLMFGFSLLVAATLITKPSMAAINQALSPPPLPIEYQRYADPATICHGQIVGGCLKGDLNSDKEVLVLGDSHAAMLNLFFDQLGKDLNFSARVITGSSCVTIPNFDYERLPEWARKPCIDQIAYAKSYIDSASTIIIAGAWDYQVQSQKFMLALEQFLSAYDSSSKKIYIMSQVPKLNINVQRLMRYRYLGLPVILKRDLTYKNANMVLWELASKHKSSQYLKLSELNMFKDAPFYKYDLSISSPIYFDEHHLNEVGSSIYARRSSELFKKILIN